VEKAAIKVLGELKLLVGIAELMVGATALALVVFATVGEVKAVALALLEVAVGKKPVVALLLLGRLVGDVAVDKLLLNPPVEEEVDVAV
jgi:hypothetical protein